MVLFVTVWLPVLICFHRGFLFISPLPALLLLSSPSGSESSCASLEHRCVTGQSQWWPCGILRDCDIPRVLWLRLGSGGTEGDCLFPSDLAMCKLRGGGGPFHLQCGIWHRISLWGWDAEQEQNKFIWKELLCPDNSPIGRQAKLCIYMQCGGLARLLSGLQALSWLDFNMTDSHQVQTQMGDVGILPREDWNSSWHSESCTGDGHFIEMGVKTTVAQREGVGSMEETLFPWEKIIASPEKRCLLQASSPRSCLAKLLCCWKFGTLFPHPDSGGPHCCC